VCSERRFLSDRQESSIRIAAALRQLDVVAASGQLDELVAFSSTALAAVDRAELERSQYFAQQTSAKFRAFQDYRHRRRVEYVFRKISLIPTPSMPQGAVSRALEDYKEGIPVYDIVDSILLTYDADDCAIVDSIASKLLVQSEFSEWADLLHQSISAHKHGLDAIAAYPLVAMIEGLLAKFFIEFDDTHKRLAHRKYAEEFGDFPARPVVHLGFEAMRCFLWMLKTSLYKYEKWQTLGQIADAAKRTDLNRHRMFHGVSVRSTRQHTLRCILMLECLGILLPETREMLTVSGTDVPAR
jgi:hypothetical protein